MKAPTPPPGSPDFAIALMRDVVAWVSSMLRLPQPRKIYTLATLPPAADFAGATVAVSDGTAGRPIVTSNGTNWVYPDGTTV